MTNRLAGFAVPNLVAMLLVWITGKVAMLDSGRAGLMIFSEFIVIPVLMGFVSALFWRDEKLGTGRCLLWSLINTGIALTLSAFLMREGVICLIIVSPLILTFISCGTLIGRAAFRRSNRLSLSAIPLLLFILIVDARSPYHHQNVVSDSLVIRARPEAVWRHVIQVPRIRESSGFWLFRLGLPRPVQTSATGPFVGAQRLCMFEQNLVFVERIVGLQPRKELTFDVVRQPAHPEILGHADVIRGQMLLRDNGDGTTTLTGNTWYRLHVYPAWYYDLWAESIGRNVHWTVMQHIKRLAERAD
jgi:hypothetical protein